MFVTVSACIAVFLSVGLFVYIATLFICYFLPVCLCLVEPGRCLGKKLCINETFLLSHWHTYSILSVLMCRYPSHSLWITGFNCIVFIYFFIFGWDMCYLQDPINIFYNIKYCFAIKPLMTLSIMEFFIDHISSWLNAALEWCFPPSTRCEGGKLYMTVNVQCARFSCIQWWGRCNQLNTLAGVCFVDSGLL